MWDQSWELWEDWGVLHLATGIGCMQLVGTCEGDGVGVNEGRG